MLGEEFGDLAALLVGDQPHRDLGVGFGREDRLGALAGVAAPDAADVQARADARALERRIAFLTSYVLDIQELLVFLQVEGSAGEHLPVLAGELNYLVVEAWDVHPAVLVMERRDHLAQHRDWIGDGSAVMTGVQVLVGAGDLDFEVGQSTHAAVDGRHFLGDHGGIGNQTDIGRQALLVLLYPSRKVRTADFLLALEHELDVVVQLPCADEELERLDVHEELALVVVCAAAPDGPVMYDGLEGVCAPLIQRLRRLDIVVPVDQDGLEGRVNHFLAIYDGVAVGRRDFREVGAGLHEEDGQPFGTAAHVILVLSLRADGRDAQQRKQLFVETFLVLFDVILHIKR